MARDERLGRLHLIEVVDEHGGVGLELLEQREQRGPVEVLDVLDHRRELLGGVPFGARHVERHVEIAACEFGISRGSSDAESDCDRNGGDSPEDE